MGVFSAAMATGGGFLRDAAVAAAHDLRVFDAIGDGPRTLDEIAAALGVVPARRRLRALLDVLVALGALGVEHDGYRVAERPPPITVPRHGWGRLAEVIRADRPVALEPGDVERHQRHLITASAAAARELAPWLAADVPTLLDLGGGAGAYTAAYLDAIPHGRAALVDLPTVIPLASAELARFGDRVELIAGDARTVALPHMSAVLLANVLHQHPPEVCRELCAVAARAATPGGVVAVLELRLDDDRRGPIDGLWFALGMAIYTDGGAVYTTSELRAWLGAAGLDHVEDRRLAAAPEVVVVTGRAPSAT